MGAIAFGQSFPTYNVAVTLSSGSVLVTGAVTPPAGTTAEALAAQLRAAQATIEAQATQLARAIPGIDAVVVGVLQARVCGTDANQATAWAACTTQQVAAQPLGSMPGDLNNAYFASGVASTTVGVGASVAPVTIALVMEGVDHRLLIANANLKTQFEEAMKKAIAFGQSFPTYNVAVTLSSGSVLVTGAVTPPAGTTAEALAAQLRAAQATIEAQATQLARAIPGIDAVVVGVLQARVCGTDANQANAWAACTTQQVVAQPLGSMPGDLNNAVVKYGKVSQDKFSLALMISGVAGVALLIGVAFARKRSVETLESADALLNGPEE